MYYSALWVVGQCHASGCQEYCKCSTLNAVLVCSIFLAVLYVSCTKLRVGSWIVEKLARGVLYKPPIIRSFVFHHIQLCFMDLIVILFIGILFVIKRKVSCSFS